MVSSANCLVCVMVTIVSVLLSEYYCFLNVVNSVVSAIF